MKLYVVVKMHKSGPEATCLGLFRRKRDAVEAAESDEDWDDDFRNEDEDVWGNEECSVVIEEHEVE